MERDENSIHDRKNFDAIHLQHIAPLVRLNCLRAGDVLLTRGRTLESRAIAALSGGLYSHAAIWIPADLDPSWDLGTGFKVPTLIEADELGVGLTPLQFLSVTLDGAPAELVAILPNNPKSAVLLRHPQLETVPEYEIHKACRKLRVSEFHNAYPDLFKLVEPSAIPDMVKPLLRKSLSSIARQTDDAAGSFCSELVAKFFELLSIRLFKVDLATSSVSPNHLIGNHSYLGKVDRAILETEEAVLDPDKDLIKFQATLMLRNNHQSMVARLVHSYSRNKLLYGLRLHRVVSPSRRNKVSRKSILHLWKRSKADYHQHMSFINELFSDSFDSRVSDSQACKSQMEDLIRSATKAALQDVAMFRDMSTT